MGGTFKKYYVQLLLLLGSFVSYGQSVDLGFTTVNPIVLNNSSSAYCQGFVPNFTLNLENVSGSATLTLTSTNTVNFTVTASGANSFSKTISNVTSFVSGSSIRGGDTDSYNWPTSGPNAITLSNAGVTNITFSFTISSSIYTDTDVSNDVRAFTSSITITADPALPTVSFSPGTLLVTNTVIICQGESITLTAAPVGLTNYEFFRDNGGGPMVSQGLQSATIITFNNIIDGEKVKVRVYNGACDRDSVDYTFSVTAIPNVTLGDDDNDNIICDGQTLNLTATGSGNWFEFLSVVGGVTTSLQSSTSATYSTTISTDNTTIIVRNYTTSATSCFDDAQLTYRLNDFTGTNQINTSATSICEGQGVSLTNGGLATANVSGTTSYIWQYYTAGSGAWVTIATATGTAYAPTNITTTTSYKRIIRNRITNTNCEVESNIVTVTVTQVPSLSVTLNPNQNEICEGDDVVLTASGTGGWYHFQLYNGTTTTTVQSSTSATYTATVINDNSVITVRSYVDSTTTCYAEVTETFRYNEITGVNEILNPSPLTICSGDAFTITSNSTPTTTIGAATITYEWEIFSGGVWNPTGNTSESLTGSGVTTTTTYRRVFVSTFGDSTCRDYSNTVTLTVEAVPSPVAISLTPNQTVVCAAEDIRIDATSTGAGWFQFLSFTGGFTTTLVSSTSSTYTATISVDNTVITVRAYTDSSTACYVENSRTFRYNNITGNNDIRNPNPATVCSGDAFVITSNLTPTATIGAASTSYQWQVYNAGAWVDLSGAGTASEYPLPHKQRFDLALDL